MQDTISCKELCKQGCVMGDECPHIKSAKEACQWQESLTEEKMNKLLGCDSEGCKIDLAFVKKKSQDL